MCAVIFNWRQNRGCNVLLTLSNLIAGFHSRGVQTDQSLKVVKTSHFKLYQCVFFAFTSSSNFIRSREPPTSYSAAANGSGSSEVTVKLMEKMLAKRR